MSLLVPSDHLRGAWKGVCGQLEIFFHQPKSVCSLLFTSYRSLRVFLGGDEWVLGVRAASDWFTGVLHILGVVNRGHFLIRYLSQII